MSKNNLYGQYEWGKAMTMYWQHPTDKEIGKYEVEKSGIYTETVRHWFNVDEQAQAEIDAYIASL